MKNLIENLLDNWAGGLIYLITDDLISFYTFFTVILAECSYLWAFYEFEIASPITFILLGYILNVIVFARLKGNAEGTKLEKAFSTLYVAVFVTFFILGCCFNWAIIIIATAISFGVTALWIVIRKYPLFDNRIFWILTQIIVIGTPFVAFVIFYTKIPFLPTALKVIIPVLYLIFSPLIAYFEDDTAASNIFELAYDITWSKEYEECCEKFKMLEEDVNNQEM